MMMLTVLTVEKKDLLPLAPPLTRYTETVIPIIKRKMVENTLTDNGTNDKLTASTISKLCIRLNTLQVRVFSIDSLGI